MQRVVLRGDELNFYAGSKARHQDVELFNAGIGQQNFACLCAVSG